MELGGDPQGERQVEGVVMGLEGAGVGATGFGLQHGGFDLQEAALIEPAAHRAHDPGTATEGFAGVRRNDQIEVALAVALLHIRQAMPFVGQGLERLAEHRPVHDLHRELAPVGALEAAPHADPVTCIHQGGELGEHLGVVGVGRLKGGLLEVELDRAALIGEGEEGQLAHHPPRHHPAGHSHIGFALLAIG